MAWRSDRTKDWQCTGFTHISEQTLHVLHFFYRVSA
ncbi:Uncharacterised protein [Vibrio cholerae]|nr:Uncharacterised protein [Vibrio cholerae]